jgi:oligopeptide/dipeptide ABC transporter ATP-binding protein
MLSDRPISNDRDTPILEVSHLSTVFDTREGPAPAVQDVSFVLRRGETLGLVGESGCGKTVTALSILRLIRPPGRIASGSVRFEGRELLSLPERDMRDIRGNRISMIFQEPTASLNPVFTIGSQIVEVFLHHKNMDRKEAARRCADMLRHVGLPDVERLMRAYPHQLSGGMRQRALIAMSLACVPDVVIADEPTTAIDVTVQAQILALLRQLKKDFGMAMLLISHDLGVVADICDRVAMMYASHIVETATVAALFEAPAHPYTVGLLRSIPSARLAHSRLPLIPGQVPRPVAYPQGCHFHDRCSFATVQCRAEEPRLEETGDRHAVACWHWKKVREDSYI